MEIAFPWPTSQGEWLAWSSAAFTILLGLFFLFAPRLAFRFMRLKLPDHYSGALAASRATVAGFYLGLGLCALLLAQPLLYMALGFCWAFTVFGRVISMLSDSGNNPYNWGVLIVEAALAAMPLAFAFGLVP